MRHFLRRVVPKPLRFLYRTATDGTDLAAALSFLRSRSTALSFFERLRMLLLLYRISYAVDCAHSQEEILRFIRVVLALPPELEGCIVEAGCWKGGSTAKFSIAARAARRKLVVFDSFAGIPSDTDNAEKFPPGSYRGALEEVKENVRRFGDIGVCEFQKGWFEETMPKFSEPVAAAYLDVDLASSTKTCLKHLYPLVQRGGYLFSQDGHIPQVREVLQQKFPQMNGLGTQKLVWTQKLQG